VQISGKIFFSFYSLAYNCFDFFLLNYLLLQVSARPKVIHRNLSTTKQLFKAAVTQTAPSFKATAVVNGQFKDIALEDYIGKYVVLFFYPLDL